MGCNLSTGCLKERFHIPDPAESSMQMCSASPAARAIVTHGPCIFLALFLPKAPPCNARSGKLVCAACRHAPAWQPPPWTLRRPQRFGIGLGNIAPGGSCGRDLGMQPGRKARPGSLGLRFSVGRAQATSLGASGHIRQAAWHLPRTQHCSVIPRGPLLGSRMGAGRQEGMDEPCPDAATAPLALPGSDAQEIFLTCPRPLTRPGGLGSLVRSWALVSQLWEPAPQPSSFLSF